MNRADAEQRVGRLVLVDNGAFRDPSEAIVIGYGYRQRHGRDSPVEVDVSRGSGGSGLAVALRVITSDGVEWVPRAVNLVRVLPHPDEPMTLVHYDSKKDPEIQVAARVDVVYYNDHRQPIFVRTIKNRIPEENHHAQPAR